MISNHKSKSVEGLSFAMIGSWVIGDAFKTTYFIMEVLIEINNLETTIPIYYVRYSSTNCGFHNYWSDIFLSKTT
jgi:hypothetical protein